MGVFIDTKSIATPAKNAIQSALGFDNFKIERVKKGRNPKIFMLGNISMRVSCPNTERKKSVKKNVIYILKKMIFIAALV
jgi:hypothetical protein